MSTNLGTWYQYDTPLAVRYRLDTKGGSYDVSNTQRPWPSLFSDRSSDCVVATGERSDVDRDSRIIDGAELFEMRWQFSPTKSRGLAVVHQLERADLDGPGTETFEVPVDSLDGNDFELDQRLVGKQGDGLGPLHNATSCAACHPNGGASGVEHNITLLTIDPRSKALRKGTRKHGQALIDVFPTLVDQIGNLTIELVVHNQSTLPGYAGVRHNLTRFVPGGIDSKWFVPARRTSAAIAAHPVVAGRHGPVDFYLSQRNTPPLFGMGEIDRIPVNRLQDIANQQPKLSNGEVTGRMAGKFGWRGQISTLGDFVSLACASEMGLTQNDASQAVDPANPKQMPQGIDINRLDVLNLTYFVAHISKPIEVTTSMDEFDGENLFNDVGCAVCHVPDVYPAKNMFSDLLLHDMGPELQAPSPAIPGANLRTQLTSATARRTEPIKPQVRMTPLPRYPVTGRGIQRQSSYAGLSGGSIPMALDIDQPEKPRFPRGEWPSDAEPAGSWDALQREWRTPPLWGIASTAPYLHDGRAATLEEAILWHGGEARPSRERFTALAQKDKDRVIAFLRTLRAPPSDN